MLNPTLIHALASIVPLASEQPQTTLPPDAVWTTAGFMNTLVIISIIGFLVAIVIGALWLVSWMKQPKEAKKIGNASKNRKDILLLAHDNGSLNVEPAWRTHNEGFEETKSEGNKFKRRWSGALPQRNEITPVAVTPEYTEGFVPDGKGGQMKASVVDEEKTAKKQEITERLAQDINMRATKSLFFPGAKTRVWLGVKSRAILLNIEGLAEYQITEELKAKIGDDFLVDLRALRSMIANSSWNESQINGQEEDKIMEGKVLAGTQNEDFKKLALYLGVLLIGIGMFVGMLYLFTHG